MNQGLSDAGFFDALVDPLRAAALRDRLWRPVASARGVELMAQGGPATSFFVLERGLIKLSYATPDGAERIKSFIVDRGVFGPGLDDAEGQYSAVTLEASSTVALPRTWVMAQIAESAALKEALARFEAWLRARKQAREQALLCDTPETRYRDFIAGDPRLAARLQQGDIARFIGMTPIAFSRLKRRVG